MILMMATSEQENNIQSSESEHENQSTMDSRVCLAEDQYDSVSALWGATRCATSSAASTRPASGLRNVFVFVCCRPLEGSLQRRHVRIAWRSESFPKTVDSA